MFNKLGWLYESDEDENQPKRCNIRRLGYYSTFFFFSFVCYCANFHKFTYSRYLEERGGLANATKMKTSSNDANHVV